MSDKLLPPRAFNKKQKITATVEQIDWQSRHVFVTFVNSNGDKEGDFWAFNECDIHWFICLDKNGGKVYAGEWCNYLSDNDPPVRVRFVWVGPALRYLVEDEQGLTYPPPSIKSIELIKEPT